MPRMNIDGDIMKQYNDKGVLIYEGGYAEYEGEVVGLGVAICKSGKGKEYSDDGRLQYEGDFYNGKQHGKGTLYLGGRKFYEGDFVNGLLGGKGKIYGRGEKLVYEGDIKFETGKKHGILGICNGKGKKYSIDTGALEYEGEFSHGKLNGYGKEYYPDGTICFEGEWGNGVRKKGKWSNPSGIVYEGEYNSDSIQHGKGKWIYEGILYYDGEFKDGDINGKGKLYDEKGALAYDGEFVDARREGHGKYYEDGKLVYNGERKDGIPTTPREGYDQEKEDKRYEDDLCGRFWAGATALHENRKGTL